MWERRWVRYHAIIAPFGILAVTALLTYLVAEPGEWSAREGFRQGAAQVDLAVPLYAAGAVLVERGVVLMFWALEQRRKWREERLQRQEEFRAKIRAEGRAEAMQDVSVWLEQVAKERGIPLEDLPPLPRLS